MFTYLGSYSCTHNKHLHLNFSLFLALNTFYCNEYKNTAGTTHQKHPPGLLYTYENDTFAGKLNVIDLEPMKTGNKKGRNKKQTE